MLNQVQEYNEKLDTKYDKYNQRSPEGMKANHFPTGRRSLS